MRVLDTIGNTPLVEVENLIPGSKVKLFCKLEGHNPGGSVKDRPAYSMILQAEKRGDLKPGMRIIEATSGNTGIALAMIAGLKGYDMELVMPENATRERVQTMKAYGARVTLTPRERGMEGAIDYAREEVEKGGAVMLDQFSNPDNPLAHYTGTGPEIWQQTDGAVTHFVSAMGTTGTIMGTGAYLKEQNPEITIIGAQPTEGSAIAGIRRWPKEYLPKIFDPQGVDLTVDVSQKDAEEMSRKLASEYGIFAGISSGGAVWAAVHAAAELDAGVIVAIVCDRGDRYLSSGLYG